VKCELAINEYFLSLLVFIFFIITPCVTKLEFLNPSPMESIQRRVKNKLYVSLLTRELVIVHMVTMRIQKNTKKDILD
jgi:hypothetical protein